MIRICPHCKTETNFLKGRQFSAHVKDCLDNPKHQQYVEQNRRTRLSKKLVIEQKCPKCEKPSILYLTKSQFERSRYKKYCSRSCANSRFITPQWKALLSRKLTKLSPDERAKRKKVYEKKFRESLSRIKLHHKTNELGDHCFVCKCDRKTRRLFCHRKDGRNHKEFEKMPLKEYLKELTKENYVLLCYLCHKHVHWCMFYLGLGWENILLKLRENGITVKTTDRQSVNVG